MNEEISLGVRRMNPLLIEFEGSVDHLVGNNSKRGRSMDPGAQFTF